jgi:hypothetical protein
MAVLSEDLKGRRTASSAPSKASVATMPRRKRWYVPLVASMPYVTSVTAFVLVDVSPTSNCTDREACPGEAR